MPEKIKCNKVAVAILGFNSIDYLRKFIPSVLATNYSDVSIVYIDNASGDGSLEMVREQFPSVITVALDQNYGFAGGYNEGLKNLEAEYFVLLNQDVEVTPDWLDPIIAEFDSKPKLGAAQPKILHYNDKSIFDYAGASGGFMDKYGYTFCRGRIFEELESDTNQYDDACEVFWATGASLVVRAKLYYELGGLDVDFFAHMEEIDFCWRLQGAGYKLAVFPKSVVYHVGGSSLNYGSYRKIYLNYRNNLLMLLKNLPGNKVIPILFIRLILDGLSAVRALAGLQFKTIWAIFMAHMSFYKRIPVTMKKRRGVKKSDDLPTIYPGSVVWQYFAKGNRIFSKINWNRSQLNS